MFMELRAGFYILWRKYAFLNFKQFVVYSLEKMVSLPKVFGRE